jgi:hypothetical protein
MREQVLRAFRSSDLRDLTRLAIDQGWDAAITGGGHVRVVNPTNGRRVILSASSAANAHGLGNARAAFRRAGLALGDRPQHAPPIPEEVPTMTTDTTGVDAGLARNTQRLHPEARKAGGAYALKAPKQPVAIAGHRVLIGERTDGNWVAEMAWPAMKSGRRQWMSEKGRDVLVARITRDLETGHLSRPGGLVEAAPVPGAEVIPPTSAPALHPFVAERIPEAVKRTNGAATAEAFPIASGLAALHATVAPTLAALEAAGKADAAALLRGELALTPAEAELLGLWRLVTRGGD